jgi:hypothetical protein
MPATFTTTRGAISTPFGSSSAAKDTYSKSTPAIDTSALAVSSSHGPLLVTSAPSAESSTSPHTSSSSSSSRKHSETGSVAAGVTIGLVLLLSITILAFIYARRHRKREHKAWKRLSEPVSLLTVSSTEPSDPFTEKPKDVPLPSFPPPTTSYSIAKVPQRFSYDLSPLGSDIDSASRKAPTVIFTEPLVCETQYEHASSPIRPQQGQPRLNRRMTPVLQTRSTLPPALIAGRRPTPELSSHNDFSRIKEVWIGPRNASRSTASPSLGPAFEPTGGVTSSTQTAHRRPLERKPVPDRGRAEPISKSSTLPTSNLHGSIDVSRPIDP